MTPARLSGLMQRMGEVKSSWKLTWDPNGSAIVLLDIGDKITREVTFATARSGEVVDLVDSSAPFLRDNGNLVFNVSFERIETSATHTALLKALMTKTQRHGLLDKKPLKIEAMGVVETTWLAGACLCTKTENGIMVRGRGGFFSRYDLTFTTLSEVATGIPPLTPAGPTSSDPGTLV